MARRAGGYRKSDPTEWAECSRRMYGEAITSANKLDQDVFIWMNDAIAHHVYRVDQIEAGDRYQADYAAWMAGNSPGQPMQSDPKYQVTRPKPEITMPAAGQGSGPTSRTHRP